MSNNNIYFKMIGQKTAGKLLLVAVVPEDMFGEIPTIFEVQAIRTPMTIYTGTYPTLRINTDTINDITEEFKGTGIAGIVTSADWYIKEVKDNNLFNINLE